MKSGQPALQLAVGEPSGDGKRTAAQGRLEEKGEEEDRGRRRRRNSERGEKNEGKRMKRVVLM